MEEKLKGFTAVATPAPVSTSGSFGLPPLWVSSSPDSKAATGRLPALQAELAQLMQDREMMRARIQQVSERDEGIGEEVKETRATLLEGREKKIAELEQEIAKLVSEEKRQEIPPVSAAPLPLSDKLLLNAPNLPDEKALDHQQLLIVQTVAAEVALTHSRGFFYGALSGENVLLNAQNEVAAMPQELKRGAPELKSPDPLPHGNGSPLLSQASSSSNNRDEWGSPESFNGVEPASPADVYSLGTMLWQLVTRQKPYADQSPAIIATAVREGNKDKVFLRIPASCPAPLRELIQDCWELNPSKRPTALQVTNRLAGLTQTPPLQLPSAVLTEEIASLTHQAEHENNLVAQIELSQRFSSGQRGVKKDEKAAFKYLTMAEKQKEHQQHCKAQYELGLCYKEGRGVPQSDEKAFAYFLAAAKFYGPAQYELGLCYKENRGVLPSDENAKEAFNCFKAAAAKSYAPAEYELGLCYKEGRGVGASATTGLHFIQLAATRNYAPAEYYYGRYLSQSGPRQLPPDEKNGLAFIEKAARHGHAAAQYDLGLHYLGKGPLPKARVIDKVQAHSYLFKASGQQHAGAAEELKGLDDKGSSRPRSTSRGAPSAPPQSPRWRSGTNFEAMPPSSPRNSLLQHPLRRSVSRPEERNEDRRPQLRSLRIDPAGIQTYDTQLGAGAYGTVRSGIAWPGGPVVAIKQIRDGLRPEVEKMMMLQSSSHAVQIYGMTEDPPRIVMEYMPGGSLHDYLVLSDKKVPWPTRYQFALQVVQGLADLHRVGMAHGDLKGQNVLLDSCLQAKISDFGLADGTLTYMAPELFDPPKPTNIDSLKAADIYSLGVLLWEMAAQRSPYENIRYTAVIVSVVKNGERLPIPEDCPKEFAALIEACWQQDPKKRPTVESVLASLAKMNMPTIAEEKKEEKKEEKNMRMPDAATQVPTPTIPPPVSYASQGWAVASTPAHPEVSHLFDHTKI
jgi:serine/threonine protein kinase